ncbi:RAB7A-interacting MON1-CCZ1 complex subunit 1-like isoform X2 [Ptychodera flava]|uniref:RAB7A-interacting MON1-CCZ1 complex subunit 1-like isoform X2 n=1 Tax=Ptychodera flava TaxID=63121 RepID=UPI00396AAB49
MKGSGNKKIMIDSARQYMQALLDFTYIDENDLVDKDFPEAIAKDMVHNILVTIPDTTLFVREIFGDDADITEILGVELLECIHWRRGALMYMYCHTLHDDSHRLQHNLDHFIKMLSEGVNHLSKMLKTRPTNFDGVQCDDSTLQLIQQGIFSDTHLLALMYAGEMCHWHTMASKDLQQPISLVDSGKQFLQKFIDIVNGPMTGTGWQDTTAKQLLQELQSILPNQYLT